VKVLYNSDNLYKFLFFVGVGVPYLNNYELTFFTWLFIAIITVLNSYTISILKLIIPFVFVLIIATLSSVKEDYPIFLKIRDITYMTKPVLGFLIGYQLLAKIKDKNVLEIIFKTGFVIAVIHLLLVINGIFVENARTIADIRYHAGYFSDFEIYCLVFLIFSQSFGVQISRKKYYLYLTIFSISIFFYLARTNFIQLMMLIFGLKGLLTLNKKTIPIYLTILVLCLISYASILAYQPKRAAKGFEGFLYKVKIAPLEPFKTQIDRHDWVEFNDNYRSYENIITVRNITNDGLKTLLFGKGIGSQIDLKQEVYLGDMYLRKISILHNGFMIVLLKSGFIGLSIYMLTLIYFFKNPQPDTLEKKQLNRIFIATGIFLFISNWVFLGFYNLTESKSLLIGFLISYRYFLNKNEKTTIHSSVS